MNVFKLRRIIREEIESSLDAVGVEPIENDLGFDVTDFSSFRTWFASTLSQIGCPNDVVNLVADVDDSQSQVALTLYDAWSDLNVEHENDALDDDVFMGVVENLVRDLKEAHRSPRFIVENVIGRLRNCLNNRS